MSHRKLQSGACDTTFFQSDVINVMAPGTREHSRPPHPVLPYKEEQVNHRLRASIPPPVIANPVRAPGELDRPFKHLSTYFTDNPVTLATLAVKSLDPVNFDL